MGVRLVRPFRSMRALPANLSEQEASFPAQGVEDLEHKELREIRETSKINL